MSTEKLIKLRIEPFGKELLVNKGTPLKDVIFEYGVEFPCGGKGYCGGCKVKLLHGDVKDPEKHKLLNYQLGLSDEYRLACISELVEDITLEIPQFESLILADNTQFSFKPRKGYGVAIDIGTTTIVAQLVDLSSSRVLGVEKVRNPQAVYGSDIMSRIMYALSGDGLTVLSKLVRDEVYRLIVSLLKDKKIAVEKVVLVGNTVMHHLFCDLDVKSLSQYPFSPANNQTIEYSAQELGWEIDADTRIIFIRPIDSFVGSDILAGIIASGMDKSKNLTALIDIGTNGEVVVGSSERIVCASTAAGPAFEGANIQMGMSAMTGAISSVTLNNGKIEYHVIGNQEPLGICGSGLIDAVSVFLENGSIDTGGANTNEDEKLEIGNKVYLTQKDIREFQLAKGALAAGLQILLNKLGKTLKDITRLYVAGGFGSYIDLKNAIKLGMLEVDEYNILKLGNSALIGAKMLLFEDDMSLKALMPKIEHISLDIDRNFQDIFVEKMFFNNY